MKCFRSIDFHNWYYLAVLNAGNYITSEFIKVRPSLSLLEYSLQFWTIICPLYCFVFANIYCGAMFSSMFSEVNLLSTCCLFCKWQLHNLLMSLLVLKWSETLVVGIKGMLPVTEFHNHFVVTWCQHKLLKSACKSTAICMFTNVIKHFH